MSTQIRPRASRRKQCGDETTMHTILLFAKASSDISRTDRRGDERTHVVYKAIKVMRYANIRDVVPANARQCPPTTASPFKFGATLPSWLTMTNHLKASMAQEEDTLRRARRAAAARARRQDPAVRAREPAARTAAPFVLVGDFNVDMSDRSTNDWFVQHMAIRYSLRCVSLDHLALTTVRGPCIDIVLANIPLKPVLEPLDVHFSDHNPYENLK
ncbi:hypothetical protein HPB50_016395 [Hyalomma asiaticum]|uniref:Uncharacterized protein n=1 Tax=Hyalomma asiaticum TaxID=266040 RepID=A0ACB7RQB0_HYAAI|nr:hypothetical protein HPB50_016395 [Hyalomma asiaticum]